MDMLKAVTEEGPEGKAFKIFFKYPEYVMNIMTTWMTLEDLDRADTRWEYKGQMVSPSPGFSSVAGHLDCTSATTTR